jgi:3'-5' exoribonuclease
VSETPQQKPSVVRLSALQPGDGGDFFALLSERKAGVTQAGKPYFHCRFRDARRSVSFMAWGDDKWYAPCERDWQVGQFFKIRGVYQEHERYGPQIEVTKLRRVIDADHDDGLHESDFVECSRHDPGQAWAELLELANKHVADEALRGLVLALLDEHGERLRTLPATKDRAYPFRGGWLEHTLSVTRLALDLAGHYAAAWPDLRPPLNSDLIVAGAILHDLGRLRELDDGPAVGVTVEGRLFGHVLLGRDLVRDAARKRGFGGELLMLLEHVLLAPLTPPEGNARGPLVPEGLIVQHADELDLKMAAYARALLRDAGPGPFTERDPAVGRALLKARRV